MSRSIFSFNFWVCRCNPVVSRFKWIHFDSTFIWYQLLSRILKNIFWKIFLTFCSGLIWDRNDPGLLSCSRLSFHMFYAVDGPALMGSNSSSVCSGFSTRFRLKKPHCQTKQHSLRWYQRQPVPGVQIVERSGKWGARKTGENWIELNFSPALYYLNAWNRLYRRLTWPSQNRVSFNQLEASQYLTLYAKFQFRAISLKRDITK